MTTQKTADKLSPKPGAGVEALEALKEKRRSAGPPTRRPVAAPATSAPAQPEAAAAASPTGSPPPTSKKPAPKKPATKKQASVAKPREPEQDVATVGSLTGNFRQIKVYVPTALRSTLEASVEEKGSTFGEVAMDAVRSHHKTLRAEAANPPVDESGFAPRSRRRRRVPKGEKVATAMLITPEESEALAKLAADVDMSVTLVVVSSLRAYLS